MIYLKLHSYVILPRLINLALLVRRSKHSIIV